ncbi:MAG: HlyC/CorC family transporter [Deltaproteobacteria bacterium]|nr:HlyC/CorC family transporter [Deltaproteobacteria bacterium]
MIVLLVLLVLVLFIGLLNRSEQALLASRRTSLQQSAHDGRRGAVTALALLDEAERLRSTVQVGVVLACIGAGAYAGIILATETSGLTLPLVVAGVGFITLVIGGGLPRRLALQQPERFAIAFAPFMRLTVTLLHPLVWIVDATTAAMLRVMGVRDDPRAAISDDQVQQIVTEGEEAGVFEATEAKMVKGALSLDDRDIASLMTPRPDIVWIDLEGSIDTIRQTLAEGGHDRYPVAEGTLDKIQGVVYVRDFLGIELTPESIRTRIRAPLVVPVLLTGLVLLERFKEQGTHFALVVDEYGAILGIVTLHDILEALIGELPSDGATDDAWVTRQDDGVFLVDGSLPIAELEALLSLSTLPAEKEYRTAGGLVVRELRRIPRPGDAITLAGWRIEVVDMDRNRVDALRITRADEPNHAAESASG